MKNQKGFSVIIIIAVVALGVGGFIAWRLLNQQSPTQTQADQEQNASQQADTRVSQKIIAFEKLGIKITVKEPLASQLIFQEITDNTWGMAARLTTKDVADGAPACGLNDGSDVALGVLFRINGTYPENAHATNAPGSLVKQFPGFYIAYRTPQQPCSEDQAIVQLIADHKKSLIEALETAEKS
ncbi:MAG TPA: hypothetical protein VFT87_02495 [Candidatus Saccharimonadales bacterium]|nr:hypothetical protein [Candidatus Saccharimonadales bacterium]